MEYGLLASIASRNARLYGSDGSRRSPGARVGRDARAPRRSAILPPGLLLAWAAGAACAAGAARPAPPCCPVEREVVLASQAAIARLAGCTTARGLTIRSGGALDVSALRALTTITGDLVIGPTVGVEEITLGALRAVGGTIHVASNGLLQGVYLPQLERAGRIEIDGNASLTTIAAPRLAVVHGALRVTDNASLELLDLSALTSIEQTLVLTGDPKLALLEVGALRTAGRVELGAPSLPPEIADALRSIAAPSIPAPEAR
jgi:hypothetical protein